MHGCDPPACGRWADDADADDPCGTPPPPPSPPGSFQSPRPLSCPCAAPPGPSPEGTANWVSRLLFSYANALVRLGKQKHLQQSDLWGMLPSVRRGGGAAGGRQWGRGGGKQKHLQQSDLWGMLPSVFGGEGHCGSGRGSRGQGEELRGAAGLFPIPSPPPPAPPGQGLHRVRGLPAAPRGVGGPGAGSTGVNTSVDG